MYSWGRILRRVVRYLSTQTWSLLESHVTLPFVQNIRMAAAGPPGTVQTDSDSRPASPGLLTNPAVRRRFKPVAGSGRVRTVNGDLEQRRRHVWPESAMPLSESSSVTNPTRQQAPAPRDTDKTARPSIATRAQARSSSPACWKTGSDETNEGRSARVCGHLRTGLCSHPATGRLRNNEGTGLRSLQGRDLELHFLSSNSE